MDAKMPIVTNKKWITLVACILAISMLAGAVLAMTQREEGSLEYMPSTPAGSWLPTTLPQILPTEPVLPSEPVKIPSHVGATLQPSLSQNRVPPTLELNTFTKKDFGKSNGYVTCKSEEYWLGVDVSVWQESINWEKVAAAGFKFAIIRVAYRGWSKAGELHLDPRAKENLDGAIAAGLKVGVYIYSQAINVQEAREEAQYVLDFLDGQALDMPIVFDWELPDEAISRARKVKAKTMQACALAFCEEIIAAGYQPMVYFNQWQGSHQYNLAELRAAGAELWLAMYTRAMTYTYKVQMWQYTPEGKVPGIKTKVDINIYFPYH